MNILTRTTYLDSLVAKTKDRIALIFDLYPKVFVSFSGGKDSTVMAELVKQVADSQGRKFVTVYNDIETIAPEVNQYVESKKDRYHIHILQPNTIEKSKDDLPSWIYWDAQYQDLWCKPRTGIPLHDFKGNWYKVFEYYTQNLSDGLPYCNFIGIRAQESFWRNMTVSRTKKNNPITWLYDHGMNAKAYPLHDWRWDDIWDYILDHDLGYNKTYDYWTDASIKHSKSRTGTLYTADEANQARWETFFIYEKYNPDFYQKIKNRMEALGVNFEQIKNAH